jgi:hypothetical protein
MSGSVLDFWRFAMSDLRMHNVRGYFAEYLVGRALDLEVARVEWDDFDVLWGDVKIEVKSSAYLQSWAQRRPSTIAFGGLRGRRLDIEAGDVGEQTYNADVYVFAWNTQIDPKTYAAIRAVSCISDALAVTRYQRWMSRARCAGFVELSTASSVIKGTSTASVSSPMGRIVKENTQRRMRAPSLPVHRPPTSRSSPARVVSSTSGQCRRSP